MQKPDLSYYMQDAYTYTEYFKSGGQSLGRWRPKNKKKVGINIGSEEYYFRVIAIFLLKFQIALLSIFFGQN